MSSSTSSHTRRSITQRLRRNKSRAVVAAAAAARDENNVRTPHSGYHYDNTPRRFFEGWYWRVTMPSHETSFALIYSREDPFDDGDNKDTFNSVGVQIMGPNDGYLAREARGADNTQSFWARRNELALGFVFGAQNRPPLGQLPRGALLSALDARRTSGFSATATRHEGVLDAMEWPNEPTCTVSSARWSFDTTPVLGWGGGAHDRQKATAGWLAALPVFEPHWQVLMAHGTSTGTFTWGDTTYEFEDAPTYAEKNWGGSFPRKWFWAQCNDWTSGASDDAAPASVTLAGATRASPLSAGGLEDVAILAVHVGGAYYEVSPMVGTVSWDVSPWGRWHASGSTSDGRVQITLDAECAQEAGVPLRAPTADGGLATFCRDTFHGDVRVVVKEDGVVVAELQSDSCALEVGGGPWWSTWRCETAMSEVTRTLLRLDGVDAVAEDLLKTVFPGY